jgi:phosphate uptake regulator
LEIRKIQQTGGSSYVISLPKTWVNSLKIKKNDPIGIIAQPDNTLLITTKITGEQVQITKEFNVDEIDEPDFLFRCLIGAYIVGFDNIKLRSKNKMPPFTRTVVRKFTQMTIGQEVVEETGASISIKDLLDPMEMPFASTIRRMYVIARSMFEDSINIIKNWDAVLADDVISRDNDIDRLHWLISRQCSILLRNVNLAEKLDITPGIAVNYSLISKFIERIADHAVNITRNIQNLEQKKLDDDIINKINQSAGMSLRLFDSSLESLFKKKMNTSNKCIESIPKLVSQCEKINTLALSQKGITAISIGNIAESIRRVSEYSGDIAESVINHLIRQEI